MAATVIGAELRLDDKASQTLDKLKSGFGAIGDKVNQAQSAMLGMASTAIGTAVGLNLGSAVSAISELAKKGFESAIALQQAEKNAVVLSGAVAKAGTSFETLQGHAKQFVHELKSIEVQTGITGQTLGESFAQIADKMNPARASITATGQSILMPLNHIEKGLQRSEAQITQLFRDIGNAGKLVAGGPDALAKSFANFSATSAKASDPIVQMIAMTGTMKGSAKQVAEQLKLLTDASALSFAQAAIEKMAKTGRSAPPDFQTTVNQLTSLRDQFVTQFGQPILKTVVPVLDRFRATIEQNRTKIEEFAKIMGDKVGKYVDLAATKIQDGFRYLLNHGKEIGDGIERGAKAAERVFKFIYDNRELIAVAFGAKAVAPGIGAAMGVAKAGYGLSLAGSATSAAGSAVAGATAMAQSLAVMAAFTAALAALAATAYQLNALWREMGGHLSGLNPLLGKTDTSADQAAREEALKRVGGSVEEQNLDQVNAIRDAYVKAAAAQGKNVEQAMKFADAQIDAHLKYKDMQAAAEKAKQSLESGGKIGVAEASAHATTAEDAQSGQVKAIADMYNLAVKSNNIAAAQYAANLIAGSSNVQTALVNSKLQLEGGFEGLSNVLGEKGLELSGKLKGLLDEASGKGAAPTKPVVQFNNNTFNLKQDFRDQDPDRVALIFRQDILKQAESRRQSRVGGAFGL